MEYFYLHQLDKGENVALTLESQPFLNARTGAPMCLDDVTDDVVFKLQAGEEYGYDQYDPDFTGELEPLTLNQRLLDYYDHDSIFSVQLANLLRKFSAPYLQTIPIKLRNSFNNESILTQYEMVNVTNSFSIEKIQKDALPIDSFNLENVHFDHSIISPVSIFRLKPFGSIIVKSDIATAINNGGFKGITAYPVGNNSSENPDT